LGEVIGKFNTSPVSEEKIKVNGKSYKVISHYTGNKDLDKVLYDLAKNRVYKEIAS